MQIVIGFDPIIAQVGPFQLGWHGLLTGVAVVVAVWFAMRLAARRGFATWALGDVVFWAIVAGGIGARLFHVLDHLEFYAQNPPLIFAFWEGGIAVYGAFIGGVVGGLIAAWRAHLPIWRLLDVAGPAMLVGQGLGRFA